MRNIRFVRRVVNKLLTLQNDIVFVAGDLYDGVAGDFEKLARPWADLVADPQAAALGVGYIPRERRVEGLVLSLPIVPNITLASLATVMKTGAIQTKRERGVAESWVKKLHVRTPSVDALCLNLSGGNQQNRF